MDRISFFSLIENDFFDIEECYSLSSQKYCSFPIEKTLLVKHFSDDGLREQMKDFFINEYNDDEWQYLIEELTGYIQMLSANTSLKELEDSQIMEFDHIYKALIQAMFDISRSEYTIDKAKYIYYAYE